MPVQVSYPGVYVEEVPSGVVTIGAVSTSTAAFAGWASKGAANTPVQCLSWADFERAFGGLDPRGVLGYTVSQFFANGGSRCYVVRLTGDDDKLATATIDGLVLEASGPGIWANSYKIVTKPRADDAARFRLDVVRKGANGNPDAVVETFSNLSLDAMSERPANAILGDSAIVRVKSMDSAAPVSAKTVDLTQGADGDVLEPDSADFAAALMGDGSTTGIYALGKVDLFNLLNVPAYASAANLAKLEKFCRDHRAMLLIDSDKGTEIGATPKTDGPPSELTGSDGINAAYYYPWILAPDPKQQGRIRAFPPCGAVAGAYARTDAARGVWKAPAGTGASLSGVSGVVLPVNDSENGLLNPQAVNCIRHFPIYGTVIWGARTLRGNDEIGDEWKYIPVRRTALFIEESLFRGLRWVVFEPNDEPLWAQIRLNVGSFLHDLFRQGAFQGSTPRDAYFVRCDKNTTTQSDINRGIVNVEVGFAPLKPAEFVIIRLQQIAGQLAV